jgi:serine/threonine protein kinase
VPYPSLEQYNEAFQNLQFALTDHELKIGQVKKTGLGLPLALCGGFALTYNITTPNKKYAVRCFHKESKLIEKRYDAISKRIATLKSQYFLQFEFQYKGIRIGGEYYPIVKMEWAMGETIGEFVEKNYNKKQQLQSLINSLLVLVSFLEVNKISHGDIQPGNIMVSTNGSVQLIDYDGMYVEALNTLGSSELGHRNFQHPKRTPNCWNYSLDRFSFISIIFSLQVLQEYPEFWRKTQSDGDAFLFRANDFDTPKQSALFRELYALPKFAYQAKIYSEICEADFNEIPTLNDFLLKKVAIQKTPTLIIHKEQRYISAHPVLDASNYLSCLEHVGDIVEVIGKIYEVKKGKTKYGKPYIFINFGNWQNKIVKIAIWSEGLSKMSQKPDDLWVGKWLSVSGLMEPPYVGKGYTHLSVTISQNNQLHILSDKDAQYRLGVSIGAQNVNSHQENSNQIFFKKIIEKGSPALANPLQQSTISKNEAILNNMKSKTKQTTVSSPQNMVKNTHSSISPTKLIIIVLIITIFIFIVIL